MGRKEKLIKRWKKNRPAEVPINDVWTVIKGYFDPDCIRQKSSHIILSHEKLVDIPGFGSDGEFTVVVRGGQKVIGLYIKRLLLALEIIRGEY